jgi:DNA processing protein
VSGGRDGIWRLRRADDGFPAALQDLDDVPDALYGCGSEDLVRRLTVDETVTIVGSRHPSSYGLEIAEELGHLLGAAGLVVVSGMALGIDAAVHRGVLAGGGSTVAVLGGGPNVVYPRSERRLYERIVARGAVISEVPPDTRPGPGCFPKRNRIMAALGAMTVVVEAAEPSGSLITAEGAYKLGREVGAVPGRVTTRVARGTNGLLADGAAVIRDAQDVLDRLVGVGMSAVRTAGPALDPELGRVADAVDGGAVTPDSVALASGMQADDAAVALARLELLGYVRVDAAGRYARTSMSAPEPAGQVTTLKT